MGRDYRDGEVFMYAINWLVLNGWTRSIRADLRGRAECP